MTNKFFAIGIPTINRADLLNPTLEKYLIDFPNTMILIVDNGNQKIIEHKRILVYRPGHNLGVAASWNYLCKQIFTILEIPYALILNDDIYLGKFEHEITECINKLREESLLVNQGTWCSFIMPASTFGRVGEFDEGFKIAYFEDEDYSYRLKLAGTPHFSTAGLKPLKFINSASVARDAGLNQMFEPNRQYYTKKWGGQPKHETFKKPFNGKNADTIIYG